MYISIVKITKGLMFLIDGITFTNIAKGAILSRCLSTSWYKISKEESVSSSKPLPKWVTKFPTISYKRHVHVSIKYSIISIYTK